MAMLSWSPLTTYDKGHAREKQAPPKSWIPPGCYRLCIQDSREVTYWDPEPKADILARKMLGRKGITHVKENPAWITNLSDLSIDITGASMSCETASYCECQYGDFETCFDTGLLSYYGVWHGPTPQHISWYDDEVEIKEVEAEKRMRVPTQQRFLPSVELAKMVLKSASGKDVSEDNARSLLLGKQLDVTSAAIGETQHFIQIRVERFIATTGYRAAAESLKIVRISNGKRFMRSVSQEILSRIPVDPYEAGEFLERLHSELTEFVKTTTVSGRWGSLKAGEQGLFLEVMPAPLPELTGDPPSRVIDVPFEP